MGDPFSVSCGALGLATISAKLTKYITLVVNNARDLDEVTSIWKAEIESLTQTHEALRIACHAVAARQQHETTPALEVEESRIALWARMTRLLGEGDGLLQELEDVRQYVLGKDTSAHRTKVRVKFQILQRARRLLSKNEKRDQLRDRLMKVHVALNMVLTMISM